MNRCPTYAMILWLSFAMGPNGVGEPSLKTDEEVKQLRRYERLLGIETDE